MVRNRTTSVKSGSSDREVATNVLFSAWLASRAVNDLVDRAVGESGLTGDEFAIYSLLVAGPITPTELASWMAAPPTTISSSIKRLESRGHLAREPNPHDGRSYRIGLTTAGRRAHQRAGELFVPVLGVVERALGGSEPSVMQALEDLRGALDAARAEPPADPAAG
jgi:DNA-binding MarR family transcriptional regulator